MRYQRRATRGNVGRSALVVTRRSPAETFADSIPAASTFRLAARIAGGDPAAFLAGVPAPDDRDEPRGKLLRAEGVGDAYVESMLREERRNPRRVHEHVLVSLVVAAPGALLGPDEGRDLAQEEILGRPRKPYDHGPVITGTPSPLVRRQVVAVPQIQ